MFLPMNKDFYLVNAMIVNEGESFHGELLIRDGWIDRITRGESTHHQGSRDVIDLEGRFLIPGVIDDHVHFREPGLTHKGDILTESRAAVAGGVTSFMDMPNTVPPVLSQDVLSEKYRLASHRSLANFSFYMGTSNNNFDEVLRTDPSKVCGIKIFMGTSTANLTVDDPAVLESFFSHSPALIAVHCEDDRIIRQNMQVFREKYGDDIPAAAHPQIRDALACYSSSSQAVSLAREHGTRLHVLHVSTAAELGLFDMDAPLEKKSITSEVCVHHLWFSDADYERLGNRIKWNPAIKSAEDKEALFRALLDNRIDVIATDHAPHTLAEKDREYINAPSGAPFVQHSLVAMMEFYHRGMISLEKVVEMMCHHPAVCFRIDRRGFIREGYHADLAVIGPHDGWTVDASNMRYKCGWSPLEGETFHSAVTHTFVNGYAVYNMGKIDESVKGRRLLFTR
jgi:dihydroorotase